eukprot:4137320-Pleurochrysis_carterae.AAC.3
MRAPESKLRHKCLRALAGFVSRRVRTRARVRDIEAEKGELPRKLRCGPCPTRAPSATSR